MGCFRLLSGLLLVTALLIAPATVQACPLCAEAVASGSDSDDDVSYFAEAMNQSIYLMIAVPYTSLGILGFMIYRGVKQNEAYRAGLQSPDAACGEATT